MTCIVGIAFEHVAAGQELEELRAQACPGGKHVGDAGQRSRAEQATRATLLVAAPGAFALEIQMASASIIEAVNRRLGFGCIGAIQIVQAPRPAPVATAVGSAGCPAASAPGTAPARWTRPARPRP